MAVHIEKYPTHIAGLPVAINFNATPPGTQWRCCRMRRFNLPLTKRGYHALKGRGRSAAFRENLYGSRRGAQAPLRIHCRRGGAAFGFRGACIYYAGPCPTPPGFAVGSCGPTTSSVWTPMLPTLYEKGVQCVIGKGQVAPEVKQSIVKTAGYIFLCHWWRGCAHRPVGQTLQGRGV